MQKRLAFGPGVKILDQKNRGGGLNEPLPASLRVDNSVCLTTHILDLLESLGLSTELVRHDEIESIFKMFA